MDKSSDLQRQFTGYRGTPLLWEGELFSLSQFKFAGSSGLIFDAQMDKRVRLGHLVEYFVQFELENENGINVLANNVQVYSNKRTVGEFDLFIESEKTHYQIEVVFKFYLYDKNIGDSEIDRWIGPNRKDSLIEKITKIKKKQFPLIELPESVKVLETYGLDATKMKQCVYFKAKLYTPIDENVELERLNSDCVAGFYISFKDLDRFSDYKIYIPSKHNWLVKADDNVNWLDYETASNEILAMIEEKRSPLVWFKNANGIIEEGFVVWY